MNSRGGVRSGGALELYMLLNLTEPKEPNPREFTSVCALELYLLGIMFEGVGVAALATGA